MRSLCDSLPRSASRLRSTIFLTTLSAQGDHLFASALLLRISKSRIDELQDPIHRTDDGLRQSSYKGFDRGSPSDREPASAHTLRGKSHHSYRLPREGCAKRLSCSMDFCRLNLCVDLLLGLWGGAFALSTRGTGVWGRVMTTAR
jgi:hypothetical protein